MVRSQAWKLDLGESLVDLLGHLDGAVMIAYVQQDAQFITAET